MKWLLWCECRRREEEGGEEGDRSRFDFQEGGEFWGVVLRGMIV